MARMPPRTMLLFYDGYELRAAPGLVGQTCSHLRRGARFAWRSLRRKQTHTGFYTAFLGLKKSLEAVGWRVRVNDFAAARRNPKQPIGVAGYPSVVAKVDLPNPVIFGPGDYGLCEEAARVAGQSRFKLLIQPSQWAIDFNQPWVGPKSALWFAGIDTAAWPDLSSRPKTTDVVIYDKIRWFRDERVPAVLERCQAHLKARGLNWEVVRYGAHHIADFRSALARSRAMIFLCEHETQGIAYQEALASGLPVFAWDEGELVDPILAARAPPGLAVSTAPYFDDRCGALFKLQDMEAGFDAFWARRETFQPRAYVEETLGLEASGRLYLSLYEQVHAGAV
ncbi:glycosyltransferase [Brevundimonas sp. NPDC046655]|uniref:glycosyltransferase n=1 Tax=unclassified Brevundimonas TaxID=2622653 RepID=UPI00385147FB